MYKIELNHENRVITMRYTKKPTDDGSIYIDSIPEGPIDDNKYVDGRIIHDPRTDRPAFNPGAPTEMQILKGIVSALAMVTGHAEVLKNVKF